MFQRPIGGQGGDGDVGHCIVGIHIRKSKIGRRQNNSCVFVGCNGGVGCRWGIIYAVDIEGKFRGATLIVTVGDSVMESHSERVIVGTQCLNCAIA